MKRTYDHELLLMDPIRVISFEPDAIKDHLEACLPDEGEEDWKFLQTLNEEDFRKIGDACIDCEALWELFDRLVMEEFKDLYDKRLRK